MNIYEKIKEILVSNLQVNENDVKLEAELINDLGINSLELADLILVCEEEFDIEVDDKAITTFVTVGDVVKYLEETVGNN